MLDVCTVCEYVQNVPAYCGPSLTCWVTYSVYLQHLHSWCLQRSRHTNGGEQWCFLQASEEQPMETPCEVTTWSPSEGCSRPRGMERPLNLKSRKQPGGKRERVREKKFTIGEDTSPWVKPFMDTHLRRGRGVNSYTQHALTHINRLTDIAADQHTPTLSCMQTPKQPEANLSAWASFCAGYFLC